MIPDYWFLFAAARKVVACFERDTKVDELLTMSKRELPEVHKLRISRESVIMIEEQSGNLNQLSSQY
jgi:hypothetical protein